MKLVNRIKQDQKENLKRVNTYYIMRTHQIGKLITQAKNDAIQIVSAHLSLMPKINSQSARRLGVLKTIDRDLHNRFERLAHDVNDIKELMLRQFNLWGRLYSGFVARKAQPPWIPVKLDLYNGFDVSSDWDSRTHFYFKNMADALLREVTQGVMKEESMHDILQRVRSKFQRGKKNIKSSEVNWVDKFYKDIQKQNEDSDMESWDETAQVFDSPTASVSEGVFTIEDIDQLKSDQIDAMRWSHRQYRPWFDDTLKRKNADLRAFEVNMMSDLTTALHTGMLKIGSENMGIEDFQWAVSKPQPKCDQCTSRDGLTMDEISKTIKDEWGAQPPPLHPNCYCQLIPKIKDDWADNVLKQKGYEFDPEDGVSFEPTGEQRELGFTDMSWDEWLANIGH